MPDNIPSIGKTAFNCPHCHALAKQNWYTPHLTLLNKNELPRDFEHKLFDDHTKRIGASQDGNEKKLLITQKDRLTSSTPSIFGSIGLTITHRWVTNIWMSKCFNCDNISIWVDNNKVFPKSTDAPLPNPDMSDDVTADYLEARLVLEHSPRASAALLRLCIQKICKELGKPGKNINTDIGALVEDGLDARIQQALDIVRVTGNNAVHPGAIDLKDDQESAENLFKLVNLIVDRMISEPKQIDELYKSLPKAALDGIENRDKKP